VAEIASSRCALFAMTTSTIKFLLADCADHTGRREKVLCKDLGFVSPKMLSSISALLSG
jgi:hypothetical protein